MCEAPYIHTRKGEKDKNKKKQTHIRCYPVSLTLGLCKFDLLFPVSSPESTRKMLIHMLKGRNIHTCSNSTLIHGYHTQLMITAGQQTISIVMYVRPL